MKNMMKQRVAYKKLTGLAVATLLLGGIVACSPDPSAQVTPKETNGVTNTPTTPPPTQGDKNNEPVPEETIFNMEDEFTLDQGITMQVTHDGLKAMPPTVNYMRGVIAPDNNVTLYFAGAESQARVQVRDDVKAVGDLQSETLNNAKIYKSSMTDESGDYTRYMLTPATGNASTVIIDLAIFPDGSVNTESVDKTSIVTPDLADFFKITFDESVQSVKDPTHKVTQVDYSSSPYSNPIFYDPKEWTETIFESDPTQTTLTSADGNVSIVFYYNAGTISQSIFDNTNKGSFSAANYIIVPVENGENRAFIGATGDGESVESSFRLDSKTPMSGTNVETLIETLYGFNY